jgi:hypothetical protein
MDYKAKLQANNTELENNNIDLQSILDTINNLPEATASVNLDAEIADQDSVIAQIQAALEGKAAGGSEPVLQTKTVTPSTSTQTVVPDGGYDGLSKVTVNAIPSTYIKPTTTKAATTYTPTTTNQTISAGTYCSGTQTIKGDANLVAGNIKSGVSIFGVNGSYVGSGGGGDGGSVATCNATFYNDILGGDPIEYRISRLSGGTVEHWATAYIDPMFDDAYITDIICGSLALVTGTFTSDYSVYINDEQVANCQNGYCYFTIPNESSADITISVML